MQYQLTGISTNGVVECCFIAPLLVLGFKETSEFFIWQSSKKLEMLCYMIEQGHGWVYSLFYCSFWYVTILGIQQDDIGKITDSQNSVLIIQRKYNWPTIFRHKLQVVYPPGWWFWASWSHTASSIDVKHVHLLDGWNIV